MTDLNLDEVQVVLDQASIDPGTRAFIAVLTEHIRAQREVIARQRRVIETVRDLPDALIEVRDQIDRDYGGRNSGRRAAYEDCASRLRNILSATNRKDT